MARRALSLLTLLAAEALAVATLHGLGRIDGLGGPGTDPAGWLASASPEAVVAGGLRLTALALAWWLLATVALGTAGLGTGAAGAQEPPPPIEVRDGRAVESIPDPAPPTAPSAPVPSPV